MLARAGAFGAGAGAGAFAAGGACGRAILPAMATSTNLDSRSLEAMVAGFGALADPSRLLASAQRIYGDLMQPLWGDFLPVPVEQLCILHDEDRIDAAGLRTDYVSVRRAADLGAPGDADEDLVVLAAAYLGRARLIDNLRARRRP